MLQPGVTRSERWLLAIFLVACLAWHVAGVSYHWSMGFLSGHEFRQAQTAITSYYIDRQNNFSLLYETPILGKPWVSILMEVPIYEWAVVGLSRVTHWPHHESARAVSAGCFYLMLPAVFLLLGRLGVPRWRRAVVLGLVLTAPVYIYYSRAFLMDSMALMATVWFLAAFARALDERRVSWLVLAIVAGTVAALVKSATLAVWLPAAAGYSAWLLWRDLRAGTGWRRPVLTCLWSLAGVGVALGALRAWIAYTDPLKAAHASAWIFTSQTLTQGNWGLFDVRAIFTAETWRLWMGCWEQAMLPRWLLAGGLGLGLLVPGARGRVLLTGGLFFLAQFFFPYAYAYQDYYYFSCAIFAHAALGFGVVALLERRWTRPLAALLVLGLAGAQGRSYWADYRQGQSTVFSGDLPFTKALRELTPENSILIVGGADWAAMTPYYSQRKALMVRNGLEFDHAYLNRAFGDLAGETVSALVVFGPLRKDHVFLDFVGPRFELDLRTPTFSDGTADIYVARPFAAAVRTGLKDNVRYPKLDVSPAPEDVAAEKIQVVSAADAQDVFSTVQPAPIRMRMHFGAKRQGREGTEEVILAHPDSDLWIPPPANAHTIVWRFGILPGAYEKEKSRTDGVEFIVEAERPDGTSRRLFRRYLDPWTNAADRGDQRETIAFTAQAGETLRFSTRPGGGDAFDWAYWVGIEVR